jgi:hypothetical protein
MYQQKVISKGILEATDEKSISGSVNQVYGSKDLDPDQNVTNYNMIPSCLMCRKTKESASSLTTPASLVVTSRGSSLLRDANNYTYRVHQAVLRIRIHMFLGLVDPYLLVRGMDPDPDPALDPDPSIIMQK